MQHFFVGGIGQEQEMDAAAVCGGVDKVVKVASHQSFLDGFLTAITYGIYSPRQSEVWCTK